MLGVVLLIPADIFIIKREQLFHISLQYYFYTLTKPLLDRLLAAKNKSIQPASSKRDIYLSIIRTASSFGQSNRDLSIYLCNQRGLGGEELVLGVHEELHVGPVARGEDGGGVGVLGGGRA